MKTEVLDEILKSLDSRNNTIICDAIYRSRYQEFGNARVKLDEKIVEFLKKEKDPMILQEVIEYLSEFKIKQFSGELVDRLVLQLLEKKNLELGVKFCAVEYLGLVRTKRAKKLLQKELTDQNRKELPKLCQMVEWSLQEIER